MTGGLAVALAVGYGVMGLAFVVCLCAAAVHLYRALCTLLEILDE